MGTTGNINPAPGLNIPVSTSTVSVSVIDTTSSIRGVETWKFFSPSIKGHDYLAAPAYSFLIHHEDAKGGKPRRLLFDLGIRKDWWNYPPFLTNRLKTGGYEVEVKQSVREILESNNVSCASGDIEAIIWSHWHWDHTGNPDEFPKSTKLIVGPGFKKHLLPGYPGNPDSSFLESDYEGRELQELEFHGAADNQLKLGKFDAVDYFGDGSFFFLNTPGHAIGHICALARVTSNPDSFIFMGGDAAHHPGEWRPSPFQPLPQKLSPHPFTSVSGSLSVCPGELFEKLLPGSQDQSSPPGSAPFYYPAKLETGQIHYDVDEAILTIQKMQEYDAQQGDNILVVVAHDETMLDVIDFFPKTANDFLLKDWVKQARWKFLRDFAEAVGWEEKVEGKRTWSTAKKTQST